MFMNLVHGLLLLSICLSLISGAQAGRMPIGNGPTHFTTTGLGSGR